MDYYYALLESYDQLKRRKFKLSLREQGVEGVGDPRQDAFNALRGAQGAKPDTELLNQGVDKNLTLKTIGSSSGNVSKQKVNVKGSNLGANGVSFTNDEMTNFLNSASRPNTKAAKLVGAWGGGVEDPEGGSTNTDPENTEGGTEGEEKIVDPEMKKAEDLAKNLDVKLNGNEEEQGLLPILADYEPTAKGRLRQALDLISSKIEGSSEEGEGLHPATNPDTLASVSTMVISSPDIEPEKVVECLETVTATVATLEAIHSVDGPSTDQLRRMSAGLKITKNGVEFNGIMLQYRSKSTISNDPFKNMAEQINDAITKHNKEECGNLEKDSEAHKDCHVKPLKEENRGREFSTRGPILEHATVVGLLAETLVNCEKTGRDCAPIENKIKEQFVNMRGDGTFEEVENLLRKGLCSAGGDCLVDVRKGADDLAANHLTNRILNYLTGVQCADDDEGRENCTDIPDYEGPKLPLDQAIRLVQIAQQDGARGVAMLVASTRGFNAWYDPLDIEDATVWGGKGANLKGQKDDIRLTVTKENWEKFKPELQKALESDRLHRELDAAANGCAGKHGGIGLDAIGQNITKEEESVEEAQAKGATNPTIKTGKGLVTVGVEQKSVDTKGSRVKAGEGNNAKLRKACEKKKSPQKKLKEGEVAGVEDQFKDVNAKRVDGCTEDLDFGKNDAGEKQTAFEAACSFQGKIDGHSTLQTFDKMSSGVSPKATDEDREVYRAGTSALVSLWKKERRMDKKGKERLAMVEAGYERLARGEQPTKEQKENMTKMRKEIEGQVTVELLDTATEPKPDGAVTGEALGYILHRVSEDSGSLDECIKDVRGYGDMSQGVGLVNTTVYGSIAMIGRGVARVVRKVGGNGFSIKTKATKDAKTGEDIPEEAVLGGEFERGQLVTKMGADSLTEVEQRTQQRDQQSHQAQEVLKQFLVGQQALLEKLIDQTT